MEAIIDLAHRLGLFVVAEGIEDAEDLARPAPYGHFGGQGFHLARPMTAGDALELAHLATGARSTTRV